MKLARSHVERCLQDIWDVCRVHHDHDGDYPFNNGTATCFVSVVKGDPIMVRVWALAVIGIERSGKLLKELNDINGRTRTVTVHWQNNAAIVEQTLHINGVKRSTLGQACTSVGFVADDVGTMLAAVFGGETPVDVNTDVNREAS